MILFLLFGCASLERSRFSGDLRNAADLYARGDFEGALKVNQSIVSLAEGKPPGDQSLFNIGLIYADNKYQKKDYRKSIVFFQRVVKEYPQSPLVAQAKTWIGVLVVIEKSKEVDIELERKKKKLVR
ncbi:MAG: hypothetical protein A4E64_01015 [Syntrophorhabdus sp. PtaU1.Bin058]|nr:MAG: hypothetical protein A4E64_01015 [Syntrophorhabdus sp. PtaU1.Bin058]